MMKKKIGNIILDYTYYNGNDLYTDGNIEDDLLNIVKEGREREALNSSNLWPVLYHLSDIRENVLEWYPFCENAEVLEIGSGCGALTGLLSKKSRKVTCIELSEKRSLINAYRNKEYDNISILIGNFQDIEPELSEQYDYITLIGVWEYARLYIDSANPYQRMLEIIKKHLKKDGKIIIAIENKMGLKYWNGAVEDHTGNLYSGLNDYMDNKDFRTFSKQEIEKMLEEACLSDYQFYYPMPDYKLPEVIYTDEFLPQPGCERNYGKDYNSNRIYQFNDAIVTDQICADKMFPYFANSYLIVVGDKETKKVYAKYNRGRKQEYRAKTEICKKEDGLFINKTALSEFSQRHIQDLKKNEMKWKGCFPKIRYVDGNIENGKYTSPFIPGIDLDTLFYNYRNNSSLFIEKFCYFIETYLKPDEKDLTPFCESDEFNSVFGKKFPVGQKSLKCTNVDLIFSNFRLTPDYHLFCFDYEWVFDFLVPYEYVTWRSASQLYDKYKAYLVSRISKDTFLSEVGIAKENDAIYRAMENNFAYYVTGENRKENYLRNYRKKALIHTFKFI